MTIPPDTKDWTWTLSSRCQDCGLNASDVPLEQLGERIRATIPHWVEALQRPDAAQRPQPTVWSVVEYAAHVRDVALIMDGRLHLMLTEDDAQFANWDQDQAALDGGYEHENPTRLVGQVSENLENLAAAFDAVQPDSAERVGRRSNGSVFTVTSLGQYALHDLVHHVWDTRIAS